MSRPRLHAPDAAIAKARLDPSVYARAQEAARAAGKTIQDVIAAALLAFACATPHPGTPTHDQTPLPCLVLSEPDAIEAAPVLCAAPGEAPADPGARPAPGDTPAALGAPPAPDSVGDAVAGVPREPAYSRDLACNHRPTSDPREDTPMREPGQDDDYTIDPLTGEVIDDEAPIHGEVTPGPDAIDPFFAAMQKRLAALAPPPRGSHAAELADAVAVVKALGLSSALPAKLPKGEDAVGYLKRVASGERARRAMEALVLQCEDAGVSTQIDYLPTGQTHETVLRNRLAAKERARASQVVHPWQERRAARERGER